MYEYFTHVLELLFDPEDGGSAFFRSITKCIPDKSDTTRRY
jgi:hypothetical protein